MIVSREDFRVQALTLSEEQLRWYLKRDGDISLYSDDGTYLGKISEVLEGLCKVH